MSIKFTKPEITQDEAYEIANKAGLLDACHNVVRLVSQLNHEEFSPRGMRANCDLHINIIRKDELASVDEGLWNLWKLKDLQQMRDPHANTQELGKPTKRKPIGKC